MAKGYKGNTATREAFVTLGTIESAFRSMVEREDRGITVSYGFPKFTITIEIDPTGNLMVEAMDSQQSIGASYSYDELDALTPSDQAKRTPPTPES